MKIAEQEKVIGIVGGMGPEAGAVLYSSILRHTPATVDQEHLSAILMSFPSHIVDRTAYLESAVNINPAFSIVEVIRKLERVGANIIGIACNTAYAPDIYDIILEELEKINSHVDIVNMLEETGRYIKDTYPAVKRIGLMTSNGTYKTGIYENLLKKLGYEVVIPDHLFQQEIIHKMIYDPKLGLKANASTVTKEVKILKERAFHFFRKMKSDAIVLGCTELSMLPAKGVEKDMLIIDSTDCLARALVREAINGR